MYLPRAIELEQPRAAVREWPRGADRDRRMTRARVDEDVALRIGRHAADFAEIEAGGQLKRVGDRIELDLRRAFWASAEAASNPPASVSIRMFKVMFMVVLLYCAAAVARRRLEHQFLHAPRLDLADDDLVRIAAIHHVNDLESGRGLARLSELAEHRSVQLRLVDFAGDVPRSRHVAVRIRIRQEDVLVRPAGNTHRPADAQVGDLPDRLQVVVEHLIAVVGAIGHPDVALPVHLQAVRQIELAQRLARLFAAGLRQEPAVLVIFHDPVVAVAVGDEDVALRIPAHVGRPAEFVLLRRRSGGGAAGSTPSNGGGLRPSTISTLPSGLNFVTMFVPSSTVQMLSSLSTRTEWANSKP